MSEKKTESKSKGKRHRSPNYPSLDLETALKRAGTFFEKERRNSASFKVAAGHWGLKETSSGAFLNIAALKSFGLMKDLDTPTKERTVQLTELALRILLDKREDSPERDSAMKQAALSPKIHLQLWEKWGAELPSDGELKHRLIFDWKFNENSVEDFIKEYKATIQFAKLSESDRLSSAVEDKIEDEDGMQTESTQPQNAGQIDRPISKSNQPASGAQQLSIAIGFTGEGHAILAHIRFDAPMTKEHLQALGNALGALYPETKKGK